MVKPWKKALKILNRGGPNSLKDEIRLTNEKTEKLVQVQSVIEHTTTAHESEIETLLTKEMEIRALVQDLDDLVQDLDERVKELENGNGLQPVKT